MNENNKKHIQNVTDKYKALEDADVFEQHPFNLLSDGERVLFTSVLVSEDNKKAQFDVLMKNHKTVTSDINDVYYAVK